MTYSFKTSFSRTLSIAIVAFGMTIASHVAQASVASKTQAVSQASSPPSPSSAPKIVLTDQQKAKINEIHKNESSQILALLTPEQQAVIQKASQSKTTSGTVEADLKLTPEQQTKIASIQQQSRKQIESVLTQEQLQILKSRSPQ
jgi:Spy/CpxP family protein refolding chaperone